MKFLNFFYCCGSFLPSWIQIPDSRSRIWIRIHWPDWIRIRNTDADHYCKIYLCREKSVMQRLSTTPSTCRKSRSFSRTTATRAGATRWNFLKIYSSSVFLWKMKAAFNHKELSGSFLWTYSSIIRICSLFSHRCWLEISPPQCSKPGPTGIVAKAGGR